MNNGHKIIELASYVYKEEITWLGHLLLDFYADQLSSKVDIDLQDQIQSFVACHIFTSLIFIELELSINEGKHQWCCKLHVCQSLILSFIPIKLSSHWACFGLHCSSKQCSLWLYNYFENIRFLQLSVL